MKASFKTVTLRPRYQRIGELNGGWAAWFKIQIALVPMLFMSLMGGGIFQIIHNAKVDAFMERKELYTPKQALEDHIALRSEFSIRFESMEKTLETIRLSMQVATPEADRRLNLMEQTLTAIQSDIVSMRISLAQIRISGSLPVPDSPKSP